MHNLNRLYHRENDFSGAEKEELDELFDNLDSLTSSEEVFLGEEETFDEESDFEEEDIFEDVFNEEDLFGKEEVLANSETLLPFLDDDVPLIKIADEINRETSRMNESEAIEYMEDRMAEFLPALAAALPTIIQLAPTAISAISSIFKKEAPKPDTKPASGTTAAANANASLPKVQVSPAVISDADSNQVLRILTELIQSPRILELLNNLQSGKTQAVTANTGQQINGSNVLGVISSLAGILAGGTRKQSSESFFPEYAISNEGTFLIDPHNTLQEARLILELIN